MSSSPTSAVAAAAGIETSCGSPFDNLDVALLSDIIAFVGEHQYRFVAIVSRQFQATYSYLFPENRTTYLNASTVEHAKICWEEIHQKNYDNQILCMSAAIHGCLPALQYLRNVNCLWCS